jgi:hypothetical protein
MPPGILSARYAYVAASASANNAQPSIRLKAIPGFALSTILFCQR